MTTDQRRELAAFIRSRRERRKPEDVGLPAGGRRRTPGLRREEVAAIARVSVTWYTWLEQGREIRVSRQVLNSLVKALGLDEVETVHLFRLAGILPPRDVLTSRAVHVPEYETLLCHLDPNPAFLVNRRGDILAWNRATESFCQEIAKVPDEERNVLWLAFTSPEVQAVLVDWEERAAEIVAHFRARVGAGVLDPSVTDLVDRLSGASREFRRLWARKDLAPFVPDLHALEHPLLGRVRLTTLKLHTADDDKTVVTYLPPPGSELARDLTALLDES